MKTFLHVGCGRKNKSQIRGFDNENWKEIRFDIDKNVNPDIEGTSTDMKLVDTGSVMLFTQLTTLNTYIHTRFQSL
jgi:hypothetical protein